jgi:hypothetical protein
MSENQSRKNIAKAIKLPSSKIYAPATVTVAVGN